MLIEQVKRFISGFPLEALIWFSALVALAFADPSNASHITLCPIANLGFEFCPGCGLGRSITWLLHGSLINSLKMHPLGVITVFILVHRIIQLAKNHLNQYGKSN
jgi:hypothetical protein